MLAPGNRIRAIHVPPPPASRFPGNEAPFNAIDGSTATKYLNFGITNTGFIITPEAGPKVARSFIISTANDAAGRDPANFQIFGTNQPIVSQENGGGSDEAWTLVAEGALVLPAARLTAAPVVSFPNNTAYASWRVSFPTVKTPASVNSMQFSEIQFFTGAGAAGDSIFSPSDPIIAIQLQRSSSGYRTSNEKPSNVIDGLISTKYLNLAKRNTGFIVTPAASAAVRSFILTTANDAPERDPASYALFGTNDPIVSNDNSNGSGENWTLVSSGLVNLPAARGAAGPAVSFTNATGFSSYRMVMTSLKNTATATSMQIAEVQFFSQAGGAGAGVLAPSNFIIAVQTGVSASSSPLAESPANAIDGNTATKYLNFGKRNTGFIVTPSSGPQAVQSIRLTTANDSPDRDPITWVLVGTNDPIRSLDHSEGNAENWTFIAKGTTGLTTGRFEEGPVLSFANATPWKSYRLIFPTVRNFAAANSMQIAEVQFFPDRDGVGIPVVVAGDPILGVQLLSSNSNSPAAESAQMAIDGQASTKYLNFGRERSGIIVTPLTGPTVATGFTITTANDAPARDPAAWELYGTNEEILSANHSEGDLENWTLISSGVLDLPMDRGVDSAPVVFTNATSWNSYRFLVRTVRDPAVANSVQFGEFQLEGTVASPGVPGFLISRVTATGSPVQSVQITFGSEPGRSYGVQASTSLSSSGSWAAVGTVNATGSQTTATVNLGAFPAFSGQPRVFFRIRNS